MSPYRNCVVCGGRGEVEHEDWNGMGTETIVIPCVKCRERCGCGDALNFGEPQPDCSQCGGTGFTKRFRKETP